MNKSKPINIGASSAILELKAELLKKQLELQNAKKTTGFLPKSSKKSDKKPIWAAGSNKGVQSRNEKDLQIEAESAITYEKAKSILEEKAKLYERMTSDALKYDDKEHPVLVHSLVNFQKKAMDNIKDEPKTKVNDEGVKTFINEKGEEWAEFEDSLGRTRTCPIAELPSFLARDADYHSFLKGDKEKEITPLSLPVDTSEEDIRQMKRDKWEKEAEEVAAKSDIHYQDVLYDEVRSHGVGFFAFSKDKYQREDQIRSLKNLSDQTKETREKIIKERSNKKAQLKERLKKIRQRKRAKLGLPPLPQSDSSESEEEKESSNDSSEEEEEKKKEKPVTRPWDFGKPGVYGKPNLDLDSEELDKKWVRDRRNERDNEFAPPQLYSQQQQQNKKYSNWVKKESLDLSQQKQNQPTPSMSHYNRSCQSLRDNNEGPQDPIQIKDEMVERKSESNKNKRQRTEIPPPPTFEYYHGGGNTNYTRAPIPSTQNKYVEYAVMQGLKELRKEQEKYS